MVHTETDKSKLTITIFFTPVDHKMINSPLFLCFKIKIANEIKNAIGKNFGAIPKMFKIEYLKYVDKE